MAKPSGRKLKVFQAQFGFYDTVVAAPSRAAALRAWGTHQDLFASGQARVVDDPEVIAAAVACPETPLKRAVGSTDAFALEAANLPKVPAAPKTAKPATKAAPAKSAPKRPPADRSGLDKVEAALKSLDDARKQEEAAFRARASALEAEELAAQEAYVAGRKAATSAVVEARAAYRKAGGED